MLQPGAAPTSSRRSSTSSLSVPFATPPTSPRPNHVPLAGQSRIPKPSVTPSSYPGLGPKTRTLSAGSAGSSPRVGAGGGAGVAAFGGLATSTSSTRSSIASGDATTQVLSSPPTTDRMIGLGLPSGIPTGPLSRTRSAADSAPSPTSKLVPSGIPRRRSTANLSIVTTPGSRTRLLPTSPPTSNISIASTTSTPSAASASTASPSTPSISVLHATPPRNGAAASRRPRPLSVASSSPTTRSSSSSRQPSPRPPGAGGSRLPQRINRRQSLQPSPVSSSSSLRSTSPAKRPSPRASPKSRSPFDNNDNKTTTLPRLRKSPGLTIAPPPPPQSMLRPAPPPLPAKSPLRQLGGGREGSRRSFVPAAAAAAAPPPAIITPPAHAPTLDVLPTPAPVPPPTPPSSSAPATASIYAPPVTPASAPAAASASSLSPSPPRRSAPTAESESSEDAGRQTPTTPAPAAITPPGVQSTGYPPAMLTSRSAPPDAPPDLTIGLETPPFSSSYIQDSGPPSAPPESTNNWVVGGTEWIDGGTPTDEFDIPQWHDKALPAVPAHSPVRAPAPKTPTTPVTPVRPTHGPSPITGRSPSMPTLGSGRPRGATESSPSVPRLQAATGMTGLTPTPNPRPQSMMLPSLPTTPSTAALSRRAHLIREIANTERAHATDLTLIRDAYVGRESPFVGSRPDSQHSSNTQHSSTDHSAASTPGLVDPRVKRNSSFGVSVEELRTRPTPVDRRPSERGSGHESWAWNGIISPVRKNLPLNVNGSLDQLVTSPATTSTTSVTSTVFPSAGPRHAGGGLTPNRRPLPPADVKTVFLNLTQLAALAEELATEFERALGNLEDEASESGTDRLGEVFCAMLPRLRPLYMYYCSRHSAASARLLELQGDPAYAAHLNECWLLVKAHTHAWNLDSMLIKPVQRITKYPLLFEDLLSCTTPVHPDYFSIRQAAEGARALALDIDEAKRRKDVITSVIGKTPSTVTLVKDSKSNGSSGRGLLLRRFKKDKGGPLSAGVSPSDPSGPPPEITPFAQAQLKELVQRLEVSDKNVRRLGKEMLEWVATSKAVVRNEIDMNLHFLKWYTLDGKSAKDQNTAKVVHYKALLEGILATAWEDMNAEVCNSVMLMLGKLLDAAKNPMTIIEKLNAKASEYGRYVAYRTAKKSLPERGLLQEATDYVAIHTQLLEELPAFLEGYTRIVEIAVAAFTMAQARYFGTFRERVGGFNDRFLSKPTEQITGDEGIREVLVDLSHTRGIHKAWINAFRDPNISMRSLVCTGGDGLQRAATYSHSARRSSGSRSNVSTPLRHTPSLHSQRSMARTDESSSSQGRRRSASFTAIQDAARTITIESKSGLAGLVRRNSRNSSNTNLSSITGSLNRSMTNLSLLHPLKREKSRSRSTMSNQSQEDLHERRSFGLPRIPMTTDQPLFDASKASSPAKSAIYYPEPTGDFSALGFGEMPERDSVAESWRNSPVLYVCAAVADFTPLELGNHRFQGLFFLPLMAGDLVEVYHEIGRVADLYDFPYSQVGVENDGAVVCRAENGAIGVAMCSFLEPLRS